MSCQGYLATFQTTVSLGKNQYSKETRLKNLLKTEHVKKFCYVIVIVIVIVVDYDVSKFLNKTPPLVSKDAQNDN